MIDHKKLIRDINAASRFEGNQRAMRVTLECGHLRLTAYINSIMGIGCWTNCPVCTDNPARRVVNVEETGVLYEDGWYE